MCGLVGVFGNVCSTDQKPLKELLITSSLRGPHSTGIGFGSMAGTEMLKIAANPWSFLAYNEQDETDKSKVTFSTQKFIDDNWTTAKAVIGHNRWATTGSITSDNAHPFEHGHILGAHNGGFHNYQYLSLDKKFEVDSDAAFYFLSKKGIDELLQAARGDFALTWWDSKTKCFHMIRNHGRPLAVAKNRFRNTWMYASEMGMLEWVLKRNTWDAVETFNVEAGELLTFNATTNTFSREKKELGQRYASNARFHGYDGGEWEAYAGYVHHSGGSGRVGTSWQEEKKAKEAEKAASILREAQGSTGTSTSGIRVKELGEAFLEHYKIKKGETVCTGFFDDFILYRDGTIHYDKNKWLGKALGTFNSSPTLECVIQIDKVPLMDWTDKDGVSFKENYYNFKVSDAYWDGQHQHWVIKGEELLDFDEWNQPLLESGEKTITPDELMEKLKASKPLLSLPAPKVTEDLVKGPRDTKITRPEFLRLVGDGCSVCKKAIHIFSEKHVQWNKDHPICPNCVAAAKAQEEKEAFNSKSSKVVPIRPSTSIKEETHGVMTFPGYNGRTLDLGEWIARTKHGCVHCTGEINSISAKSIFWMDDMSPVCKKCRPLLDFDHPDYCLEKDPFIGTKATVH